jgi:hypothetical protein
MRITRNVSGLLLVSLIAALVAMMIFIPRTSGYARESVVTLAERGQAIRSALTTQRS